MATIESSTPIAQTGMQPTSVQPGGFGPCVQLELAWGRLRRFYLRRFRPVYVRRMAALRQGDCPQCPHHIIDSRDLKYWRNVCGYYFRPEDDSFHWRDRLGLARAGCAEIVCFSVLLGLTGLVGGLLACLVQTWFWILTAISAVLWIFVISFFRDPTRTIPDDPTALVSPADGTITHIDEVSDPEFPEGRAFRISIFLSIFNVHVNRMPRAGRIVGLRYFRGSFIDARRADCSARNEQLWIDLEEPGTNRRLRVKQIAGAVARRIVCWLKAGDLIGKGERIGMIKFGSRTEVLLPLEQSLEIRVKVGDVVKGGSTVLLHFARDPK